MSGFGASPPSPPQVIPPPPLPPPPPIPGKSSAEVAKAEAAERKRRAMAVGRQRTILGGSVGDAYGVNAKTLLGE